MNKETPVEVCPNCGWSGSPPLRAPPRRAISELMISAAEYNGVSVGNILSASKSRSFVTARDMLILLLRRRGLTVVEIGKLFRRDHSTICTAHHRASAREEREVWFAKGVTYTRTGGP